MLLRLLGDYRLYRRIPLFASWREEFELRASALPAPSAFNLVFERL